VDDLTRQALVSLPLTPERVREVYAFFRPAPDDGAGAQAGMARVIRELCVSHERLRAELEGAEALLREQRPQKG